MSGEDRREKAADGSADHKARLEALLQTMEEKRDSAKAEPGLRGDLPAPRPGPAAPQRPSAPGAAVCPRCGRALSVPGMPCLWCVPDPRMTAVADEDDQTSITTWVGAKPRAPEKLRWHQRLLRAIDEEIIAPFREMTPGAYLLLLFVGILGFWLLVWSWGMRPVPVD